MASVKLFRVTEFAESLFQSPQAHRTAWHPLALMLLVALWLATVGHWPLWHTLLLRTEPGATGPLLATAVLAQLTLGSLVWLALSCWRWTFKPAMTLLLIWAVLGSCAMWLQIASGQAAAVTPAALAKFLANPAHWARLFNWQCGATLLVVAVLPAILIWKARIRRIALSHSLVINAVVLVAAYALLTWLDGQFSHVTPSPMDPLTVFGTLTAAPALP